jgi:hypothetical protein
MKNKLLFIFAVIIFLLATNVHAAQVYVGVQITNTESPTGETFDLPSGTQMSVLTGAPPGATIVSGSSVITTSNIAVGDTIWTPLITLTSGNQYTARLSVSLCPEGSKFDSRNNYCWYLGNSGQNCDQVCAANGTTPYCEGSGCTPTCEEPDENCTMLKAFGFDCSSCYVDYPVSVWSGGACLDGTMSGINECANNWGYPRICVCGPLAFSGTFNFPFTASF